jgi:serine/threonine-protein kinase
VAAVPDVVGLEPDRARSVLERAGFAVDVVEQVFSNPAKHGVVVAQDPPARTEAVEGSTVTITVGVPPSGGDDGGGGGP